MAKDENVPPVVPHVHTDQTGGAVLPIRGVSNPDSPTARLETTDTGRNEFAYEGPFTPLHIVEAAPTPSLFDYVKSAVLEMISNQTATTAFKESDRKLLLNEVEHDITAHRGFLLKAAFTNTAPIFVGNRFTGAISPSQSAVFGGAINPALTIQPKGGLSTSRSLDQTTVPTFDFGATTPFGFALDPGESLFIEINRASNIYLYAEGSGQKLYWLSV
tara:strand:- start:611 stop:1261 length:651 start_codon:yes stop_codon:yes gene_type:complete